MEIALPPLRDRREDIPYLSAAFVKEFADAVQEAAHRHQSPAPSACCRTRPWPGNVRELRNTLERACMLERDPPAHRARAAVGDGRESSDRPDAASAPGGSGGATSADPELNLDTVQGALQRAGGNKSAAARALGVSRRAFYRRLDSLGIR